ncbi:MAG: isoprenylcysteine carboxylmethyltransferase family protein [Deltaproteobacteria bacterium]|nr:isoprenylcysteine carboxylmethyltransferase family protein [Deltaproteobacteria bacterium]
MIRLIIFFGIPIGFFAWSWPFLRNPRSHGFFRFFAFESIVALILLNVGQWFQNPLAAHQIVSWVLLGVSLVMAIVGFYLLSKVGKPKDYNIEDTTALVKVGAYRYIRHPLYSSIFFMGWGVFFKDPSILGIILVVATSTFITATAKIEEMENLRKFGTEYADYMKGTKMFIPFFL